MNPINLAGTNVILEANKVIFTKEVQLGNVEIPTKTTEAWPDNSLDETHLLNASLAIEVTE